MRFRSLFLVIGVGGALSACGSTSAASTAPESTSADTVSIKGFAFMPSSVHVPTGTTITWTNSDPTAHTTTADKTDAQTWDSGNLTTNTSFAVTFTKAGTYSYHCDIHNYMTGTITVGG